jgi:hypothetical protein
VVKGALLPPNKGEVGEFEAWAATIPWMDRPPSYSMFFDLRCRRDSEEKNRLIRRLRLSPEEGVRFLSRRPEEYLREMGAFCSRFMGPPGDVLFSCGSGVGGGCVDAYGQFQPCMMLRHPETVYDLRSPRRSSHPKRPGLSSRRRIETQEAGLAESPGLDTSLRSCLTGAEGGRSLRDALVNFFPRLREMRARNPDYLARCAHCFLKGLCEQCPAKSWMEHGTLDTPVEHLCDVAHAQARYLGLLEEGEQAWEVKDGQGRIGGLWR